MIFVFLRVAAVEVFDDIGEAGVAHREVPAARGALERLTEDVLIVPLFLVARGKPGDEGLAGFAILRVDDVLDACEGQLEADITHELARRAEPLFGVD